MRCSVLVFFFGGGGFGCTSETTPNHHSPLPLGGLRSDVDEWSKVVLLLLPEGTCGVS